MVFNPDDDSVRTRRAARATASANAAIAKELTRGSRDVHGFPDSAGNLVSKNSETSKATRISDEERNLGRGIYRALHDLSEKLYPLDTAPEPSINKVGDRVVVRFGGGSNENYTASVHLTGALLGAARASNTRLAADADNFRELHFRSVEDLAVCVSQLAPDVKHKIPLPENGYTR